MKFTKRAKRIFTKYHDPLLILGACHFIIVGAMLGKYPEWVRAWETPVNVYGGPSTIYEEVPVAVPLDCKTEKCRILAYIVEKFGDDAADAITLVNKCENHSFNQAAINYNKNGTTDHGIFQVNSIHAKKFGEGFKTDWKANVDAAYEIYKAAGHKFTPWTCSYIVGQTNYLGRSK